MNDELRAALDKLDAALAEARAAMEPEPRCPNCGSTRKFRQDDKGRWLCDHCGYLAPAPQPEAVLDYSGPLPSNMCPNCEDIMQWDLLSDGSWRCPACEYVLRAVDADIQPEPATEPEPRGVVVQCGGRDIRLAAIDEIGAGVCPGAGPRLYVKLGSCLSWTTTPLADIIAQAAVPNIELPPVTVRIDSYQLTTIERADCHACDDGSLLTDIIGVAEQYGEHTIHTSTLTPAQVVRMCELAGWPKPEVRCVFTYCNGDQCSIDPAKITHVTYSDFAHATMVREAVNDPECSYYGWHVREPVPVVQRMIDACREGE